jgi:ABC-type molybdate transport system substrate-binding protein
VQTAPLALCSNSAIHLRCELVLFAGLSAAQQITVAAAADLPFAMQDIAANFQKETGQKAEFTYGSGSFFQQLQNGGPFDMFFSANLDFPKKLEAAGLIEPGTFPKYAVGKIAIWGPLLCRTSGDDYIRERAVHVASEPQGRVCRSGWAACTIYAAGRNSPLQASTGINDCAAWASRLLNG